jgi:hypothetical protein
VINATPLSLYPREGVLVPTVEEAWLVRGTFLTSADNLLPTRLQKPHRPALASRYTDCAFFSVTKRDHSALKFKWKNIERNPSSKINKISKARTFTLRY